ncbi:MAG: AraC family transcriptional regulator [Bacillota bacterium]|nr:AraC family transcriptional regulator [Bacillota bacterium]
MADKMRNNYLTTTEVSQPFLNTKYQMCENFYFDRLARNGIVSVTNGHYHNMFEIYFLVSGCCTYFIENKLYDVEAGDLVLVPKGAIHKTIYTNKPTDRYLVNFTKEFIIPPIAADACKIFSKHIYRPAPEHIKRITEIFEKFAHESKHSDQFSTLLLQGSMTELLTLILRYPSAASEGYDKVNFPIENVTQYITQHFRDNITLPEMAKQSALSESYFSRLFKTTTGFGFKEYLTIIRLKEAQSLLLHTDNSICNIAYECGFNDSNYFSSVFKELNGMSPLKYRKQHRTKIPKSKK